MEEIGTIMFVNRKAQTTGKIMVLYISIRNRTYQSRWTHLETSI